MTIYEKQAKIEEHCQSMHTCAECPLIKYEGKCYEDPNLVGRNYAILFPTDTVDHPNHYNREGGMECIEEMLLVFGKEAVIHFCLLNVWKYRYRASDKNGAEDLKKADWYLAKYKELRGGDET